MHTSGTQRLAGLASALFLFGTASAGTATASILDFDLTLAHYDPIAATYGDNLPGTPNVTVDYRTANIGTGVTVSSHLLYWTTGYGDLNQVAFCTESACSGNFAEITLTASGGDHVRLNSFDLAGYPGIDHPNSRVAILVNGVAVSDALYNILGAGPSHSSFAPNLTGQTISIRFGYNDWNIGIDNINFDQVTPSGVPEPTTLLLSLTGLALFGAGQFRQRR